MEHIGIITQHQADTINTITKLKNIMTWNHIKKGIFITYILRVISFILTILMENIGVIMQIRVDK
jgi:hypothetical protein